MVRIKHYNESGYLDEEGSYANDKAEGVWKEYYDLKKIKSEFNYTDGELERNISYLL